MQDFGLVVIGAHSGLFLKDLVSEYQDHNILLVEPVPYNYKVLNENFSKTTSITQVIHGMYIKMYYKDLVNEKDYDINFSL